MRYGSQIVLIPSYPEKGREDSLCEILTLSHKTHLCREAPRKPRVVRRVECETLKHITCAACSFTGLYNIHAFTVFRHTCVRQSLSQGDPECSRKIGLDVRTEADLLGRRDTRKRCDIKTAVTYTPCSAGKCLCTLSRWVYPRK